MRALFISLVLLSFYSFGQTGKISGTVRNNLTNEPIPFAKVILVGEGKGDITLDDGAFLMDSLQPGLYTVKFSSTGFIDQILTEQNVTNARSLYLEIRLEPVAVEQKEVVVRADAFVKKAESPVSMRTLNSTEIERLPGANRDVSKVLQALPGVALRASFRNDIIIRGGSPGENKFYLDGVEVPNINHFATQGSSGGPVGLLNVNFIREVEFNSSAFPVNKANGLSSVISFKQKDGNKDALITNFAIGSSDAALTFDGPLGKKADFIFSARRSYLQFLFAALQLPFLPTYNDFQYKVNFKVNDKNKVTFIGLGAIDDFKLNTKVNDKVDDPETREFNEFILGNIPTQDQWNYTVGMNWLHYSKNSYQTFILSRNMLKNIATRYFQNIEADENKLLDYSSFEAENKFRFEHLKNLNGWKFMVGFGYEFVHYNNSTFNRIEFGGVPVTVDYTSDLFISKYSVFSQVNKNFFNDRLGLSFGLRSDVSDYSSSLLNPLDQISPVLSARFVISEKWSFNSSIGRFHQLPAYTILGYRNTNGDLVNKENNIKYIRADHFVAGLEYLTEKDSRLTVEGFFKNYTRYPFSLKDSISLANLGSDFGIIGNEEISSISTGRSYGAEFLYQQKLYKGYYGIVAYTFVTSEFKDKNDQYVASSWDSRHSVSLTGGKRFKKGWEIGLRWLFSTGAPYTPYDIATSSLKQVWDLRGQGVLDYDLLNTERESSFHQLNFRVDKKIYLQKINMDFYLDIQNLYGYKTTVAPTLLLQKDDQGNPLTDPNDPNSYLTKQVANTSGIVQPTIGVVIEFTTKKKIK